MESLLSPFVVQGDFSTLPTPSFPADEKSKAVVGRYSWGDGELDILPGGLLSVFEYGERIPGTWELKDFGSEKAIILIVNDCSFKMVIDNPDNV